MDIATLIGIVGGFALIIIAILLGGSLMPFVDIPSVVIVIGGTITAILVMFPLEVVLGSMGIAMRTFKFNKENPVQTVEDICKLADTARRESLVALEKVPLQDEFLKKGIRMVADGSSQDQVTALLDAEINFMKQRHRRGQAVFKGLGSAAPAFGMIGTLVGLVNMLQNLSDPASIGPAMAVALLTTFYGAVLSNLMFLPMAKKLEERSFDEQFMMQLKMEGVLSILNGEHPQLVKEKLMAFLPPNLRPKE
ncbi:motility protein A [Nitratidesulfovibrio vulgaris]|jgi:chemotaxis protein MotA|uniref:Chemotaxis protein PomA n=2 Tax=Nitratidesulfovibrio vulgaris TaxID=881 RepID=Q72ED8_NITV2|nr:MotA/TolQ/ExbB proton channel family protein [Nitratidesulfovibrio vulgaris]GEB79979.1 flagellar motor protein MotP [Desulfovibrio desulfuricans]HBW15353.1 motility protein A [Desulfovibrio sp.]AAS95121.1 chemotaxis protein PomA [Nitratidesulfovibrio vulgaris str. Hildenborough]ABM29335.1 MotA/TolQ/ExbB proton channel [Nitratidesulfovibrio vulgaris DP4]ADP85754.1 MotA/TolQ/ExbB proton channel [Nitratidesulfovibrio vulgaris RCH1]